MTTIIFCADPLRQRQPDPIYIAEYVAAQAAGFTVTLLDYEALVDEHDAVAATRQIAAGAGDARGIYRGWMAVTLTHVPPMPSRLLRLHPTTATLMSEHRLGFPKSVLWRSCSPLRV